jgi:hypothetical protein
MKMIEFQGKKYPSVLVNMPFGERRISTEGLHESLMNLDGSYVSENAMFIDESIFYFVSEESILLESDTLVKLILSEI